MPSFDFFSPFMAARIVDELGDVYPFWTTLGSMSSGATTALAEELGALAFLQEVQVTLNLGMIPKISAQLSPPFQAGLRFINSHLVNSNMSNRLEVQLGYARGTSDGRPVLSPVFIGLLGKPDISIDTEMSITLNAQGTAYSTTQQPGRAVAHYGETRKELITRIALGAGRNLEVDFVNALSDPLCLSLLTAPAGNYVQGNKSDWMALYELANLTLSWISIIGTTLYWLSRPKKLMGAPKRRYYMYNLPGGRLQGLTTDMLRDAEAGDMPMLSFSCATDAVWLPANQYGIVLREINEHTRAAEQHVVTHAEVRNPVGGDGAETTAPTPAMPFDSRTGQGAGSLPGDPNDAGVRSSTGSQIEGANLGIELDIETIGDPEMIPGTMVRIAGLGRRFDNRVYAVHEVTHTVGSGGFSTQLKLITNIDAILDAISRGVPGAGPHNTFEVNRENLIVDTQDVHIEVMD